MSKRKKKRKRRAQGMRDFRKPFVFLSVVRYGSMLLKTEILPFSDVVLKFFRWFYEGFLGLVIRPVCDTFWSWKYYEEFYMMIGWPTLCLIIALTGIIHVYEHTEKKPEPPVGNGKVTPSLSNQMKYKFEKIFDDGGGEILELLKTQVLLKVVGENGEEKFPMNYERSCNISPTVRATYDKTKDIIMVDVEEEGRAYALHRGTYRMIGGNTYIYLG